ncbi:hypothetical protein NUKP37_52090 [Klebsiella variicola]|uniref:Uncharacterized protein n=2 Tax=Klebsiella variicola TaxID=244366 RepID=A0A9P3PCU2_KLEVA|nr:hypothetical protein [Klebsiella variicola]GKK04484.1 hypothetical protein NUKP37_52090 [Klebsiella variicola]HCI8851040.1 hypothetical protein [Klebsiella variicola]
MKVVNDNKEIIHSGVYIIEKETSISFNFTEEKEAAKVTLEFIFDEQINNGERKSTSVVDPDNKGITLKFYNFKNEEGEGIFPKRYKLYENSNAIHSLMFSTRVFNETVRYLTITFFKENKK